MKIPKWMIPPPDWTPKPVEPRWVWRGRQFFITVGMMGIIFFFGSFLGLAKNVWDGIAMAVLGAGLLAGAGGTLALSFGKVVPADEFWVKALLRVGFMVTAPAMLCVFAPENPTEVRDVGEFVFRCAVFGSFTVVPFGLSLIKLVIQHRKGKEKREDPGD